MNIRIIVAISLAASTLPSVTSAQAQISTDCTSSQSQVFPGETETHCDSYDFNETPAEIESRGEFDRSIAARDEARRRLQEEIAVFKRQMPLLCEQLKRDKKLPSSENCYRYFLPDASVK
jgi:hypothetical protein